ncbi:hypothetical protein OROHE_015081 [Orobanche hederae]
MNPDRSWRYQRTVNGALQSSFVDGVEAFIGFTLTQTHCLSNGSFKCPCNTSKCRNMQYFPPTTVVEYLKRNGFVPHYEVWDHHGETAILQMDYSLLGRKPRKRKTLVEDTSTPGHVFDVKPRNS